MTQYTSIVLFLLFGVTAGVLFPSSATYAKDIQCALQEELAGLEEVRAARQEQPYSIDVLRTEISVRKVLLAKTVECAIQELRVLEENVRSVAPRDDKETLLKEDILLTIEESRRYYELRSADISSLGLQGTREFSRALLGWREANLLPLEKRVEVFLVWHQNQPLFEKARARFLSIRNFLEPLPPGEYAAIRTLLSGAESNLYRAEDKNATAMELLERRVGVEALPHLYSSLQLLSRVYEDFIALGEAFAASP